MTPERAFYLITYAAITAGMLIASAEPLAINALNGAFYVHFKLHIAALGVAVLLSFGALFDYTRSWQRIAIGLLIATAAVQAVLPVSARDALVHHLAVPKMWLATGKMEQITWHEWSYYPYLLQLGYVGILKHSLLSLAPLYHLAFLVITAGAAAAFSESKRPGSGAFSGLIILSTPLCMTLGTIPLVDLGLLLFSTLGALALAKWVDRPREWWLPIIAGLGFGLATLTKFNGALFIATSGTAVLLILLTHRASFIQSFKGLFYFGTITLLTISPYLIRNFTWTNNPIYPMYRGLFGATAPSLTTSLPPLAHRMAAYGESFLDVLLLPIRVFVFGREGDPQFFDGLLSPVLLVGFVPLFLRNKSSAGEKYISLSALLYLLVAITSAGARVRYLAPILGILAVNGAPLLMASLKGLPIKRTAGAALIFIHCGYAAFGIVSSKVIESVKFLASPQSATEYLGTHYPEYAVIQWINQNIPKEEIVYLLYTGNKFFWFEGAVRSGGYYSGDETARIVKDSRTHEDLYRELKIRGIKHFMTNDQRLIAGFKGLLSTEELRVWDMFVEAHLTLAFNDRGYSVWTLK